MHLLPLFSLEAIAPAILLLVASERWKEREGEIIVTFSTLFAHQSRRGSEPIAVINDGGRDCLSTPKSRALVQQLFPSHCVKVPRHTAFIILRARSLHLTKALFPFGRRQLMKNYCGTLETKQKQQALRGICAREWGKN